jgi:hypothetical protein
MSKAGGQLSDRGSITIVIEFEFTIYRDLGA